jgi:hypothetical protein
LTVIVAVTALPPPVAVITAAVTAATPAVVIENVPLSVVPSAIRTLSGGLAACELELLRVTSVPPAGAGAPSRIRFPGRGLPPVTVVAGITNEIAGPTVSVAVAAFGRPPVRAAVTVTV